MLHWILALSGDPDGDDDMGDSGTNLVEALEPLMMMAQEVDEVASGLRGLLELPHLMPFLLEQMQQSPQSNLRPLGDTALERLPKSVLDTAALERLQSDDDGSACSICLEDYSVGMKVLHLPCGHLFCADCGDQWLRRNGTCPVCRHELEDVLDDELDGETEDLMEEDESQLESQNDESSEDGLDSLDGLDWHTEDLFSFREWPQGSPLRAVRRARNSQEGELWPPLDLMAAIAGQESSPRGFSQSSQTESPASPRETWQSMRAAVNRVSQNINSTDEHYRTPLAIGRYPAPSLLLESRSSSPPRGSSSSMSNTPQGDRVGALSTERLDSPAGQARSTSRGAQAEPSDERSSRLQRRSAMYSRAGQGILANRSITRTNAQVGTSLLRGPAMHPRESQTQAQPVSPFIRSPPRLTSNGAQGATNVRSAGTNTSSALPVLALANLRRRSGLQSNSRRQ